MGCGGCTGNQTVRNQKLRQKFKRPPETLPNGAIKLSQRPRMEGLVGFTLDTADPTILRPDHLPCKHFLSQAMLEQDGSLSIMCLCMQSDCHLFGEGPLPSDCSTCEFREAPQR